MFPQLMLGLALCIRASTLRQTGTDVTISFESRGFCHPFDQYDKGLITHSYTALQKYKFEADLAPDTQSKHFLTVPAISGPYFPIIFSTSFHAVKHLLSHSLFSKAIITLEEIAECDIAAKEKAQERPRQPP